MIVAVPQPASWVVTSQVGRAPPWIQSQVLGWWVSGLASDFGVQVDPWFWSNGGFGRLGETEYLARGGVYVTGGITPRIARFLKDGAFRQSFESKAPHEGLMARIPTFIVRHPEPALEGLASFARAPDAFVVERTGREWTAAKQAEAS